MTIFKMKILFVLCALEINNCFGKGYHLPPIFNPKRIGLDKQFYQQTQQNYHWEPAPVYENYNDTNQVYNRDCMNKIRQLNPPISRAFLNQGPKVLCFFFGICCANALKTPLNTLYSWRQLEFDFPSESARRQAIQDGSFVEGIPAPIDVDVYYSEDKKENKIFVTIPRFQLGNPVALGTISDRKYNGSNVIVPYPSWDWHTNPTQCKQNRIISVYRIEIDECGRMWVLDNGRYGDNLVCAPQVLVFDLSTNSLLHKYEIPGDQYEPRSIFVTPVVDVRDSHSNCKDTFVYLADCQTYSLVVYDYRRDTSWRVTDKTMYPMPEYGTYNILGDSFDLMDGVLGMALTPYQPGKDRVLFYHAMSSDTEHRVRTSDLRNQTRFQSNPSSSPSIFYTYRGRRRTQSAAEAMDKNGILYFGLMSSVEIACWDTSKPEYGVGKYNVIANNQETLQFASGVKVIQNKKNYEELWLVTSRFQKIGAGTLSTNEINFRILNGNVDDLTHGTNCNKNSKLGGYGLRPRY